MKKVKILFYIYEMGAGGAARTLLNIINNLDRDKFQPVLVTLDFDGSYEKDIERDVTFIKLKTKRLSKSIFKLAKIIRDEEVDLVFSTIPRVNTIATLANKLSFTKSKNVVREADNLGGTLKEDIQLIFFGMVYRLSNQVVSLSEGVKNNLVNKYKLKADSIKVIYNPVDLKKIDQQLIEEIPEKHREAFDTDEKVIITAGRLVEQKDQRTLIEAFRKVQDRVDSRLVILGVGHLENDLKALADQYNLLDRVYFYGFQQNPYKYIHQADLFALSSKHEGFSHVIAESLATGTMVVSTDCKSGPSEVLDKGKYGYLCEVGNAEEMSKHMIEALTLTEEQKQKNVAEGKKRARDFDANIIVKQYEEVFLEVLSK
ncbi:glycosyltransferase [Salipaludibacillus daqingensis]|uniref:glycosyltransferase n=1 Tax=Salipaludibacillus daqingensis TaxID=3041001 RepID=UPI002475BA48|nr:glycosyltransferase [Salipaludibacillus daqingensis]